MEEGEGVVEELLLARVVVRQLPVSLLLLSFSPALKLERQKVHSVQDEKYY